MTARAVPVFMYHHVSPQAGLVTISPEAFESQMRYLAVSGYHTLTADQLLAFMNGHQQMPSRSVVLTFDDGYLDNYIFAYPILKRLGLNAIIFTVTGWIGEGPVRNHSGRGVNLPACPDHRACKRLIEAGKTDQVMLRWSEIETMKTDGTMEFHSHTHSHVRWDHLYPDPDHRLAALRADLEKSKTLLSSRLGSSTHHLCWPWGYYEPAYQLLATELGFESQYSVIRGTNRFGDDVTSIRRIDTKERSHRWFARQAFTYRHPMLSQLYLTLRK